MNNWSNPNTDDTQLSSVTHSSTQLPHSAAALYAFN